MGETNAKAIRYLRMLRNPDAADAVVARHRTTKSRYGMPRRMARKQGGKPSRRNNGKGVCRSVSWRSNARPDHRGACRATASRSDSGNTRHGAKNGSGLSRRVASQQGG